MPSRIGIFGGSFDPVHNGHLIICNLIREELKLEKIIFVPAYRSPHKKVSKYTKPDERFEMLKLAIGDNEHFNISDFEIKHNRMVYSIETLTHFKGIYHDCELFMILGSDSYNNISKWKDPDKIKNIAKLVVASRDNIVIENEVICANTPIIEISSTMIRDRIRKNLSIKYLVNPEVEHYIYKKKLYAN
ncbi:MAG: nicotinate (nicotinamide) nucleotide adenylyltransferase [Candidatus Delongbacteria bacterium]|nr:nicotinate (nicotinamide) nucleotide adenylyltransferase [Candidatus Delongbacteria bacterium]